MTTRTRSASRSKPQRMSVASAESHIRAVCDPSNARRLGSPIIPLTPAAGRVSGWPRIQGRQKDSDRSSDESRSPYRLLLVIANPAKPASPPLPQTSPLRLRALASSRRRKPRPPTLARGKMPPHSDRSQADPKAIHATSPTLPHLAASSLQDHSSLVVGQDAV